MERTVAKEQSLFILSTDLKESVLECENTKRIQEVVNTSNNICVKKTDNKTQRCKVSGLFLQASDLAKAAVS